MPDCGYYSAPRQYLRRVRQLFYPRRCPFCRRVLGSVPECSECEAERGRLRRSPSMRLDSQLHYLGGLSGVAAPFRYKGCVREAVLRAKYHGEPWTAVELGVHMAKLLFGARIDMRGSEPVPRTAEGFGLGYDCIVPVPPSGTARGYNVPERMALPIAKALDLPLKSDALRRTRALRHQAGLPFEQRLANVAGAFSAADIQAIEGRRVLLVDDVITTGATAAACAQALLKAGAQEVFAVALAAVEFEQRPAAQDPIFENEGEEI